MGYFDNIPKRFRVGPWSPVAPIIIIALCALCAYTLPSQQPWMFPHEARMHFPEAFSPMWYYNAIAFPWLCNIIYQTLIGPVGVHAFMTYTCISWSMITVRHGLSVLSPFLESDHWALHLHEALRFVSLCTATITFCIWNFALMPFLYFKTMPTPEKKKAFIKFCFSFKLTNLHVFNIFFAIANVIWSTPRTFHTQDLWCAFTCGLGYALFYLLILDRFGIHLYPVFSPRTNWVILTWTACFGCYMGTFRFWNMIIQKQVI